MIHSTNYVQMINPQDPGNPEPDLPLACYKAADSRHKNAILWDLPGKAKKEYFSRLCATAVIIRIAWLGVRPLAMAWGHAACRNSQTLNIHFMFTRPPEPIQALAIGKKFLATCAQSYSQAICVIPKPWLGARLFAQKLGLSTRLIMPHSCWIAKHKRPTDAWLMAIDLRGGSDWDFLGATFLQKGFPQTPI